MSNEGSGYKVPLTKIKEIKPHPNADALEFAIVYGFEVIVKKGQYKDGDELIYVPIDSILPLELERHLFPPESKIKLDKHRVRQIRIRSHPSQGMLISKEDIQTVYGFTPDKLEEDYGEKLRITKYEPPSRQVQGPEGKKIKRNKNTNFREYKGLNNIKWFPDKFLEGELVVIQEKLHGTNARASIVESQANTFWKKVKKFFGLLPKYEKCYGSNKVQLQDTPNKTGYYGENIYGKVFQDLDVFSKLRPGEQIFGEIVGQGIQKNYHYGHKEGEYTFVLFDVMRDGEWLDPDDVQQFAAARGFEMIPILYRGPYNYDHAKKLTLGNSVYCPTQKIREGIVIKAARGYDEGMGSKKAVKFISEKYLDKKDNTDFH